MIRLRKKLLYFAAIFIAVITAIGVGLAFTSSISSAAPGANTDRVTMIDLMARYPIDYVVGPVDVVDVNDDGKIDHADLINNGTRYTGKFTYKSTNYELDTRGNKVKDICEENCTHQLDADGYKLTNNIYGIPADKYFDVEQYIYTEQNTDASVGGRVLYGWKPTIRAVVTINYTDKPETAETSHTPIQIAENGEIMNGSALYEQASDRHTGIYVTYPATGYNTERTTITEYGTTEKYALIVPKDITKVGQGSAAFVYTNANGTLTTYRNDTTNSSGVVTSTDNPAQFTDFSAFLVRSLGKTEAPYFWQPRERLAGVFFPEDSQLKEIQASNSDSLDGANAGRTNTDSIGKSAFMDCNNMRFMVLPNGVKTIGRHAFYRCSQLADTNIPTTVDSVGYKAYNGCKSMLHISIPDKTITWGKATNTNTYYVFGNCDKLKHVDNPTRYTVGNFGTTNSTIFVMGNRPENNVPDTGAFVFERTNSGAVHALSLAGETGEDDKKVFAFPSAEDFNDGSDRRTGVAYDYIGCNGNKVKVSLSTINASTYDIVAEFAKDTWCQNVVLPKEVTTIGADAFNGSHVKYLETYAKTIGSKAFYEIPASAVKATQWFYIHQTGTATTSGYNVASDAFVSAKERRHIVYENYALYTVFDGNAPSWLNMGTKSIHYQVPIIANVVNEDTESYTFKEGDMAANFFDDSDYVKNPTITPGNNSIVYTKRLATDNYGYNYLKTSTGEWSLNRNVAEEQASPTLSNMTSTIWYSDMDYSTRSYASDYASGRTTPLNLYTKLVARPLNIFDETYDGEYKGKFTFGQEYTLDGNIFTLGDADMQCIDFYSALGLSNDYVVTLKKFAYPNGAESTSVENLHNAGTYEFTIALNASKWGVWSSDYIKDNEKYFTAAVEIARKAVDYSSLSALPEFVNASPVGGTYYALYGASTPIYRYNDGWYVAQQSGQEPNDTRVVTNSYSYYTGNATTIMFRGETLGSDGTSTLGDCIIRSRNGLTFTNTNDYTASFDFTLKSVSGVSDQYNYIFYYGDNNSTKYDNVTDSVTGLSMTAKQDFSFHLTKRWYIVMETNMFIVSGSGNSTPYVPLNDSTVTYGDTIALNVPALNKTASGATIHFEILYTPLGGRATAIKSKTVLGSGTNSIGYYINSSMPAGEYTLKLYGSEVDVPGDKKYPAITGEYTVTVLPRAFDVDDIADIHTVMNGTNAYPVSGTNKALHDSISTERATLNNGLIVPKENTYWKDNLNSETGGTGKYFSDKVTITYNWEGSGRAAYLSYEAILSEIITPEEYTFYYCISANNYETIGGEDSSDRTLRSFKTVLYTDMKFEELYAFIIDANGMYFHDVTYTGSPAQTRVPSNQYYSYSFDDKDENNNSNYINVREKASVTLTLYNSKLARWNTTITDTINFTAEQIENAKNYYELSSDGKSLKIFYNIVQADNAWLSAPQVPGWSYNGFKGNESVYTIMGTLRYPDANVYYRIGTLVKGVYEWIDMGGSHSKGSEYFTVDENGAVTDTGVITILNNLPVDTYYLGSYVSPTNDGNVKEYITPAGSYGRIVLSKAINRWETTPSFTPWQYGGFSVDTNFIAGVPTFSTAEKVVYKLNGEILGTHKEDGKIVLDAEAVQKLKALDAAPSSFYKIIVDLQGTDDYLGLSMEIPFIVVQATTNLWTVLPAISGWTYGANPSSLLTAGTPNFGVDTVIYKIQSVGTDGNVGSDVAGYVGTFAQLKAKLVADPLDAGNYNLNVVAAETDNYVAAVHNIRFNVLRADDSWDNEPSITESWTFGTPSANITIKNGTLQHQTSAAVTVEYYKTTTDRNGQLVVDYDSDVSATLPTAVGSYARVSRVAESTNYNELEHVSFFNITKVPNTWSIRPEMMLRWTWGNYATVLEGSNLIRAAAQYPATITYSIYKEDGTGYAINVSQDDIKGVLEKLPAGQYSARTVVAENDNYDAPVPSYLATTIVVDKADFVVTTAPSSSGWTWGATNMPFTAMAVQKVISAELTEVDATIEYSLDGGESWKSFSAMHNALQSSAAGTYTVDVRVTYPNYNDNTDYSVTVEISTAAFSWTGDETSQFSWSWNNSNSSTGKILPELVATTTAKDVNNVTVTYVVRQSTTSTDPLDHDGLLEYLYDTERIGKYTVTATASTGSTAYDANFTSKTRTFNVEVKQAKNSWSTTPTTEIEFEFDESRTWMTADKITLGVPTFGEVRYYNGNSLIANADNEPLKNETLRTELVRLINALQANVDPYPFNIRVEGNSYYEGINAVLNVTVKGIASSWKNTTSIQDYQFTYGSDLSIKMGTVVIPELEEIPGSASSATLNYSIKYVNYKGEESTVTYTMGAGDVTFANIISHVKAYLTNSSRNAGTYTVTAVYNPKTTNYAELNTSFTITVNRFTVDWTAETKALEDEYIFELGNATEITPVTNSSSAGITVPVKYVVDGTETEINNLKAYVNSLPIGNYRIEYSVTETDNYTGLTAGSMRVVITKAANRWVIIDRKPVWEFRRGEDIEITIPQALRGNNIYKIGESGDFASEDFNTFLKGNNYAAGDYTITIRVDETNEYYGTEAYTFTLRILKNDNSWIVAPLSTITKVGRLKEADFTIPQAKEANSLLRFDVAKAGGVAQYGLDVTAFKAAIPSLTDGTYTITMRVGGTGTGYTDSEVTLLNNYNADYNPLIATTVVTVTRAQLKFSTHLAVPDWSYDNRYTAKNNVTASVFAIDESISGSLTNEEKANITEGISILYSITGNNVNITGKTLAQFKLALEDLKPGTYSATASIATTETYIGVSETVAFTVSKITTVWVNADVLKNLLTWTYGTDSSDLQTPKLTSTDERTVKYTLWSGSNSTEDISGTEWYDKLGKLGAGTYIFSAYVDGDDLNTSAEYLATVTVVRANRVWDVHPSQTQVEWTYHDTVNNFKIEYEYEIPYNDAKDENGNPIAELKIYVDNVLLGSGVTLQERLNSLVYGTHSITATVAQTAYYGALTETITLVVARANNSWFADNIDTYAMKLASNWSWINTVNDESLSVLGWQSPIPANGNSVIITVDRYGVDAGNNTVLSTVFVTTLSYNAHQLVGDDNGLKYRLRSLDAGNYRITAQVLQDDCYKELTRSIDFEVKKANNSWIGEPVIGEKNGSVSITLIPKYGNANEVVFEYAAESAPDNWSTQLPTAKGNYFFKAHLAGSDNYNALEYTGGSFSIEKENNGWVVMPGVNGWEWNAFDRNENIFRGTAISNGLVTFKIMNHTDSGDSELTADDFSTVFSPAQIESLNNGFSREGESGLVSAAIETMLKALKPRKQYKLIVTANGGEDYQIFSSSVYFEVTKATNEWKAPENSEDTFIYPNVDSFIYGGNVVFTAGATKYGANDGVRYQIVDEDGVIVRGQNLFEYDNPKAFFNDLPVGSYVLQVWALGSETYNGLYSSTMPYTKPFSVTAAINAWKPGKTAPTSISKYYADLQTVANIRTLFDAPEAQEGTPIYQLYNTNYTTVSATRYKYTELLAALKALDAGDYILRITLDGDTLKNYGNLTVDVSLSIMRYTTNFVNLPEALKGQWKLDASGATATVLNDPTRTISARYGEANANGVITTQKGTTNNIIYTFGSQDYTWNELKNSAAIKALNSGSYQVVVSVLINDSNKNVYSAASTTIQLDIGQGTNEWRDGWEIADSLLTSSGNSAGSSWTYGSTIKWTNAVPKYGNTVYVEIKKSGSSEALSYITINYKATDGVANAIASVGSDLSKLDAGNYVLTVSAPADTNWAAMSTPYNFTINQAGNSWVDEPNMQYSVNNEWIYGKTWTYGSAARPIATAKHGTVTYTYYVAGYTDEAHKLNGMPVNAGEYTVVISVANSVNYTPLNASINFKIEKATDMSFIVSSGTTGWTWQGFNRMTNLFTGIPTTRGNVSYTILCNGKVAEVVNDKGEVVKLQNIMLEDANGEHTFNPDNDVYVPKYYADLINKLDAGKYVLRINVAEVTNYIGFPFDSGFEISPATNGWVTTPRITPWSYGGFKEATNMPSAVSLYGNPSIIITSSVNGDVYYSKIYDKEKGYVIINNLKYAPAGWYEMEVNVEGASGKYSGLELDEPIKFQVFVIGSSEIVNSWITDPYITDWTATLNISEIVMPIGTPLRGLPYFKFFDGTTGKEITADGDVFIVDKGDVYFQNLYIPMADGRYYMMAYACRYDLSGENIIDEIDAGPIWFTIEKRDNYWENEPRIADVLYLGEKANWAAPTASAQVDGSVITFIYRDKATGKLIDDEIPTKDGIPAKAGKYTLTAIATAKFCKTIYCDVDFSVEYSYNAWKSAPTIEGWSAEYEGNNPVAEAVYGTDKIVYTYATQANPDVILPDGKPVEEGDYIMYANIYCEDEGYANIKAEFKFTITPAFDTDLLIVDIVLGTVGCVLTIGVIYLAVRKRRKL